MLQDPYPSTVKTGPGQSLELLSGLSQLQDLVSFVVLVSFVPIVDFGPGVLWYGPGFAWSPEPSPGSRWSRTSPDPALPGSIVCAVTTETVKKNGRG